MREELLKLCKILFAELEHVQKSDSLPGRGDVVARLGACLRDTLKLAYETPT